MKVIVTIPAYNEEKSLLRVIESIPKKFSGVSSIKTLVWDDGSTDGTKSIAEKSGADYVFASKRNLGLAKTFRLAIQKAVVLGADIVVNIDADGQYDPSEISKLIKPILSGSADMVSGNRQISKIKHMDFPKKYGNIFGSWVIRILTGLPIKDASSGFRAYTSACVKIFRFTSSHTYTHETLVDAAYNDMVVAEVPVTFRCRVSGDSRLISGVAGHIRRSAYTIVRTVLLYKALPVLGTAGLTLIFLGVIIGARFLYFFVIGEGSGHTQSLILATNLVNVGFTTVVLGLIADSISINSKPNNLTDKV